MGHALIHSQVRCYTAHCGMPRLDPILLLEDDALLVRTLRRALELARPVTVAPTIAAARALLAGGERLSGCVLDLALPDGSGLELLAHLRKSHPPMPALVLTGNRDATNINRAFDLGASYLCKPVSLEQIRAFSRRVVARAWLTRAQHAAGVLRYADVHGLSETETEILAAMVSGITRASLAHHLDLSEAMVKHHIHRILAATGADSLPAAALEACRAAFGE